MSTDAEIEAALDAFIDRLDGGDSIAAALAAVEPLIRARLARDVQAACPKHLTRDYTPVDAAYDHAAPTTCEGCGKALTVGGLRHHRRHTCPARKENAS